MTRIESASERAVRCRRGPSWRVVGAVLAACAGLMVAGGGCNIVGPAAVLVAGPEKAKAQFELDRKRSVVVFIDDRNSQLPDRGVRQRIAKAAERALLDAKVVDRVLDSDALAPVLARERWGKPMGISEIGQAVGAEVVVYATVDQFTLSPDRASYAPVARMRLKVMDAVSGARLFPVDTPEWHGVVAEIPRVSGPVPTAQAERTRANQQLAERAGIAVARTFFDFEVRPIGENLQRPK